MNLSSTDQLIFLSAKLRLSSTDSEQLRQILPEIESWDTTVKRLIAAGVGPLFLHKLSQIDTAHSVPKTALNILQQTYFITLKRSLLILDTFSKVVQLFTDAKIQVVALKGIHLGEWLYKDVGLRQMSDMDLLVNEADGPACLRILRENGFRSRNNNVSEMISQQSGIVHFQPMIKNNVAVEIHINLHRKRKKYHLDPHELIKRSELSTINNTSVRTLELHDLIIFLCIHLDKHFVKGEPQLTGFFDLTNILETKGDLINWDVLIDRSISYNCINEVFKYLLLTHKYFKANLPVDILNIYAFNLSVKDEILLHKYIQGEKFENFEYSSHIANLRQIKSSIEKVRYLFRVIYPDKAFMLQTYKVKHPTFFWFYYPYRHWRGVRGLLKSKLSRQVNIFRLKSNYI